MTVSETMQLRSKLLNVLLAGCERNSEFFKRLLIAQQLVTECLASFRDDFNEVNEDECVHEEH